ncbi:MAG: amino acid ABC transporter permease [Candidatus Poribacteria bacterium]|nr:amino acid ABC transporter permease [Candidatus Poribacteria bacterium]
MVEEQVDIQQIQPPTSKKGPVGWLRENLFNTWYNAILTCVALLFLYFVFKEIITWAFTEAEWNVIPANLQLFAIGPYPRDQVYRIWICLYILTGLLGLSAGVWRGIVQRWTIVVGSIFLAFLVIPFEIVQLPDTHLVSIEFRLNIFALIFESRRWLLGDIALLIGAFFLGQRITRLRPWILGGWVLSFPITMFVLHGFGENAVQTSLWGGLLLTLILAVVGIVVSFPLGVFLALCRQSKLPAIKWVSVFYIETVRGVPLITILFMGGYLITIFIPFNIDLVIKMMIAITLFSAAYMAENVRGGLQAIPRGQHEAAQAVGLNYVQSMLFIVLPQALRSVIPAIVGQFIALFKDTSLVYIIGLVELLGVAKSIINNPDWLGLYVEVYSFIALIYFIFCFAMSKISQEIEADLGVGKH